VNVLDICVALKDLLNTVPGVRAYETRVDNYATSTGDGLTAVMVVPGNPLVGYYENATMTGSTRGGICTLRLMLQVRVPRVSEVAAQKRIYELVSTGTGEARSIYDAIRPSDLQQTLGGLVDDIGVVTATVGVVEEQDGLTYVGADIALEILARRSGS
jgi:hypothetical protein